MNVRRSAFVVALVIGLIAGSALPQRAEADASSELQGVLATLRGLSPQSFNTVALWTRNGTPPIFAPVRDYERAEAQILNLGGDDRQAVLSWLQGNGRGALYARGATQFEVGPPRQGVDVGTGPLPTPTPNAWRELRLASTTLGGASAGNIVVLGGFAAAKRDGTGATACISFKNAALQTATRVVFAFPLVDAHGNELGTLTLDRQGTFSADIPIMTYQSFNDWAGGTVSNRDYAENCASLANGIAAVPILSARYATYRVSRVEYTDGTVWTPSKIR